MKGWEKRLLEDLLDLTPKENMNNVFHNSALAVKKMKFVSFVSK